MINWGKKKLKKLKAAATNSKSAQKNLKMSLLQILTTNFGSKKSKIGHQKFGIGPRNIKSNLA